MVLTSGDAGLRDSGRATLGTEAPRQKSGRGQGYGPSPREILRHFPGERRGHINLHH